MAITKLAIASTLLAATTVTASAEPTRVVRPSPLATTERWGGGLRLTGLSGIGALPGVNFGGEVAVMVRRYEAFAELAIGQWKPEDTQYVTQTPTPVELELDVWTVRAGWASMTMPLRAWGLVEVGEVAGTRGMQGVVTRMVMGDTPENRQWRAIGAGVGVAWPMSDQARLIGNMELELDVWTLRAGWASMTMPLRAWGLVEVGEVAGTRGMQGVVTRMVMGDTPENRQWRAIGAGVGVAWPMSDQARLIGNMELAVPINRDRLMLDRGEAYQPDPMAARYSLGIEVGWR